MIKTAVAAAALLVAFVATPAVAANTMTLAPHYSVAGTNPNGSAYSGTVDVDVISSTTFLVAWHIKGSGSSNGFGMRMGDTISATYLLGNAPGLVIYRQTNDGGFRGIWAIRGQNGSGTEVWTPQ